MSAIDFYFDFSSPYGYLAAQQIDDLGAKHGREVVWHPVLLGAIFKITEQRALAEVPLKKDYLKIDVEREARRIDAPFHWPPVFPFPAVAACRAYYWLAESDREAAKDLAKALYHEAFGKGGDISKPEAVIAVARGKGLDDEALAGALQDQEVKEKLRRAVDEAIEIGVFGSPYMIVDGEAFWGQDRLSTLDTWLESGGW